MVTNIRNSSLLKIIKNNHLIVILLLFFVSESLAKISLFYRLDFYRIGAAIKIIFLVYFFINTKFKFKFLWGFAFFLSLFILSQYFINTELTFSENLIENSLYFIKYLFIFFVADYFTGAKKNDKQKLIKVVFVLLRMHFCAILIGLFFGLRLFSTYPYFKALRFGYDGFIQMNSQASYIYIFATISVIYEFLKTKKTTLDFYIIIISSLLVGTKTLYLFYALIVIYFLFYFKTYKKTYTYFLFSILLMLLFFNKASIYAFLITNFKPLVDLYDSNGFLSAITSTRNHLLTEVMSMAFYDYWTPLNYLIGGGFFNELRTEMAFADLFLFWGLAGSIIYIYFYYNYIVKHYLFNPFLKYSIIALFIVAFLGGNFFTNAVIAIYVVVFTNFFILESEK